MALQSSIITPARPHHHSRVQWPAYAPVKVQGIEFAPGSAQEFIDGQPFSRTL